MAWPKKKPSTDVGAIMSSWKTGQVNPKQEVAEVLAEKDKKSKAMGGVPGLMATNNNLKSLRSSTLPKGFKK